MLCTTSKDKAIALLASKDLITPEFHEILKAWMERYNDLKNEVKIVVKSTTKHTKKVIRMSAW